jgi:hypothetical protein
MGNDAITPDNNFEPERQIGDAADLDTRTVRPSDHSADVVDGEVLNHIDGSTKIADDEDMAALDARLQKMPLPKLQENIVSRWGHTEKELGPYFYHVRRKMSSQGARNDLRRIQGEPQEGFSAWCEQKGIPGSTANSWADNYETQIGKRKPKDEPEVKNDDQQSSVGNTEPKTDDPSISTSPNSGQSSEGTIESEADDSSISTSSNSGQSSEGSTEPNEPPSGPTPSYDDYPDPYSLKLALNVGQRRRFDHAITELSDVFHADKDEDIFLSALLADFTDTDWKEFKGAIADIQHYFQTQKYEDTVLAAVRTALSEVRRERAVA